MSLIFAIGIIVSNMTIFQAFILGIIEGVTEFLPISSTAHLIFASKLLGVPQSEFVKLFEVFIQSGAILAVVFLYFRYIVQHKQLLSNILISFLPTALVGFFLHGTIKGVFFESNILITATLFAGGVVFIVLEYFIKQGSLKLKKAIGEMSTVDAAIIGFSQALAVVPGVSRAGAVIVTMILLKYKRTDSAIYSFLLAVPTIFAASAFDLIKTDITTIQQYNNLAILSIGFITSFITALIIIKWFISFLQKNTLIPFGVYRIILTAILLLSL